MFRTDRTLSRQLFAFTPRDRLPESSDVWLYMDLFDALDLDDFYFDYSAQGEEGLDPRLILRTVFYGLTHGVVSGRKVADACIFDNRYIVLSGEQYPSYRTFYRFIERHGERLEGLFVQIVRLAQKMGLVSLGRIAIDGSRFKANTSKYKAMNLEQMDVAVDRIRQELAELKANLTKDNCLERNEAMMSGAIRRREFRLSKIEDAKRALQAESEGQPSPKATKSFADVDALAMQGKGEFVYGYNCQAAVDDRNQIVVAAELHSNQADTHALHTVLDSAEKVTGKRAKSFIADAGYRAVANLELARMRGITPFIAVGTGKKSGERPYLEQIRYSAKNDSFLCDDERRLKHHQHRRHGLRDIKIPLDFCEKCTRKTTCLLHPKLGHIVRLPSPIQHKLLVEHQTRMRSAVGRAMLRKRKAIVEPVFGNIKNKGIRIGVRGTRKVAVWWKMACTAHNIEKIIRQR